MIDEGDSGTCGTRTLTVRLQTGDVDAQTVSIDEDKMSTTLTTREQELRDKVMQQLAWDPEVDATLIGVTNTGGIVTLSGYVNTYVGRLAAERVARRVYGVKAVVNELAVKLTEERIDPDIAKDAAEAAWTVPGLSSVEDRIAVIP